MNYFETRRKNNWNKCSASADSDGRDACAQRIAKSSGELLWRLAFYIEFLLSSDGRTRHSAHEHLRDELPSFSTDIPFRNDLLIG